MIKQLKIKNLIVIPLIASAVFLANPALASNNTQDSYNDIQDKTSQENVLSVKDIVVGKVASVNDEVVTVTTENNLTYTIDTGHATIMKESEELNTNPYLVRTSDIKVGDAIAVRGEISDQEA
jgi:intein/homing endonuclease